MKDKMVLFTLNAIRKNPTKAKDYINAYLREGITWGVLTYSPFKEKEEIEEELRKLGLGSDTVFVRKNKDNRSMARYVLDIAEAVTKRYEIHAIYMDFTSEPDKTLSQNLKRFKVYPF